MAKKPKKAEVEVEQTESPPEPVVPTEPVRVEGRGVALIEKIQKLAEDPHLKELYAKYYDEMKEKYPPLVRRKKAIS